jgi:hypothetical protein
MLRNIIIAIIAIIVLYFILSWAGIIGGADDVPEAVEPAAEAPATN